MTEMFLCIKHFMLLVEYLDKNYFLLLLLSLSSIEDLLGDLLYSELLLHEGEGLGVGL